jgi:hypothetical protein
VLLPEPVSAMTTTTGFASTAARISSSCSEIGSAGAAGAGVVMAGEAGEGRGDGWFRVFFLLFSLSFTSWD